MSPRDFEKSHSYSKNHSNHFSPRKQRFRDTYRGTGVSSLKHSQKASNHSRYPSHSSSKTSHDHRSAPSPKKPRQHSPPGVFTSVSSGNTRKRSSYSDRHSSSSKCGVSKEGGKLASKKDVGKSSVSTEKLASPVSLKPFLEDIDSDEDLEMTIEDLKPSHSVLDDKASKVGVSVEIKEGEHSKRLMKEELFDMMEQLESDITSCERDLNVVKAKQTLLEGVEYRYQIPRQSTFTSAVDDMRHLIGAPGDDSLLYNRIYCENKALKKESPESATSSSLPQTSTVQYHQPFEVPGYWDVLERHETFRPKLQQIIANRRKEQYSMEIELCERYDALSEQWEKRLERLERKAKDHKTRELFEKVFPELKRIKEPSEKLNRTDSRGIGIIRSEAEFNELMDALNEQEESKDRHRRCHAVIPPMVLHPVEKRAVYANRNGLLRAPLDAHKDHVDTCLSTWNDEERMTFQKVYALYPKNFEKISKFLPKKTVQQCVQYYYLTKKKDSYKVYVQAVKEERRKRGLSKGAQESPTSPPGMLSDTKETISDVQPVQGLTRRPTLLKPKLQRSHSTGSPYGDWSLDEIEKLTEALRTHGKTWWKVSQIVGSKNQNRCRTFFMEFQSSKALQLKEAVDEYLKNKSQSTVRLRRKVEQKLAEPPPPAAKSVPKPRTVPKVKEEEVVESGDESTESGSSSDSSETHTAVSSNDEPEEQVLKPQRQRRVQVMRSMSVPRRFSEDSLDVLFTAAEIVEGGTVPSDIALHDHTYALSQRVLYHSMDMSPTSGLSLIAAAAAVVSPSLQTNSSSASPLLAPVKAPRGRPPNSAKRANSTSQRLQPTFLSPAGPNMQVPLMDQKGGPRARSRSTGGSKPMPSTGYIRSTTPRNLLSPTKPKPATPTNLPPMPPVAKSFSSSSSCNTPTTPSTPNTAFEALVNAAVAAPPASVPDKPGEGEGKNSTHDSGDSVGSYSPSKTVVKQQQQPTVSNNDTMQHPFTPYSVLPYYPSSSGSNGQQWVPQPFPLPFFYASPKMYHPQQAPSYPMSVFHPVHMHYSPPSVALAQPTSVGTTGSTLNPIQHPVPPQGHGQSSAQQPFVGHNANLKHEDSNKRDPTPSAAPNPDKLPLESSPTHQPQQQPGSTVQNSLTNVLSTSVSSSAPSPPPLPPAQNPSEDKKSLERTIKVEITPTGVDTSKSTFCDSNKPPKSADDGERENSKGNVPTEETERMDQTVNSTTQKQASPVAPVELMDSKDSKVHLKPESEDMIELSKLLNHQSPSSGLGQDSEVEEQLKNSETLGSILAMGPPPGCNLPSSSVEFNHERFSPNMAALSLFSSVPSSHSNEKTPSPQSSNKMSDVDDTELKVMDTSSNDHS